MSDEKLRRLTAFAVIGTSSLLPLLVLPAMVGVLVDEAALSERFAGWVASANFLGVSLAALLGAFRMHRLDLRRTATLALALAAAADGVSGWIAAPTALFLALRIATGLANGAAQVAAIGAIARGGDVERGYGLLVTLQFVVAAVGCYVLPVYSSELGAGGMFALFAAADLCALALARRLPGRASAAAAHEAPSGERGVLLASVTLLALAGYALFEAANTAQYTYLERLGVALAFADREIGIALMFASLAGIPGAFAIVMIGQRFGTLRPLAFGIGVSVVGLVTLISSANFAAYLLAGSFLGFAWAFCLPFIQTLMASLDPHGSAAAAGSSAATIGVATGPGIAASVVGAGEYERVFAVAIALLAVSLTGFFASARRSHEHRIGVPT